MRPLMSPSSLEREMLLSFPGKLLSSSSGPCRDSRPGQSNNVGLQGGEDAATPPPPPTCCPVGGESAGNIPPVSSCTFCGVITSTTYSRGVARCPRELPERDRRRSTVVRLLLGCRHPGSPAHATATGPGGHAGKGAPAYTKALPRSATSRGSNSFSGSCSNTSSLSTSCSCSSGKSSCLLAAAATSPSGTVATSPWRPSSLRLVAIPPKSAAVALSATSSDGRCNISEPPVAPSAASPKPFGVTAASSGLGAISWLGEGGLGGQGGERRPSAPGPRRGASSVVPVAAVPGAPACIAVWCALAGVGTESTPSFPGQGQVNGGDSHWSRATLPQVCPGASPLGLLSSADATASSTTGSPKQHSPSGAPPLQGPLLLCSTAGRPDGSEVVVGEGVLCRASGESCCKRAPTEGVSCKTAQWPGRNASSTVRLPSPCARASLAADAASGSSLDGHVPGCLSSTSICIWAVS
mmetsp:Transcript_51922/g.110985  ORF Transcript_51922/g.110985 Transcript_51922/m.110985 type:complete len:467 (+) Transcript_51922:554-1954(+)